MKTLANIGKFLGAVLLVLIICGASYGTYEYHLYLKDELPRLDLAIETAKERAKMAETAFIEARQNLNAKVPQEFASYEKALNERQEAWSHNKFAPMNRMNAEIMIALPIMTILTSLALLINMAVSFFRKEPKDKSMATVAS